MKEQLENRLTELKREFELGQNKLREIETEEATLRQTLLRISGAIQVLDEELKRAAGDEPQAGESLQANAAAQE
jgi:predicted nuclease with TOPRIM domain